MTTQEEALAQPCPQCKAEPGKPCTYMAVVHEPQPWSEKALARAARVGTPTKKPHLRRYQASYQAVHVRYARKDVVGPSAAVRSYRRAQAGEYVQMQEWLRENHHLLFSIRRL